MNLDELREKFNLPSLFSQLEGLKLDIFSEDTFVDASDFALQRPTLKPLGELHFLGNDGGRGFGQRWANQNEDIFVDVDRDGFIKWIHEK